MAGFRQGAWVYCNRRSYAWSYLLAFDSPPWLWTIHIAGLIVFALLTVGLFSRVVSVLALVAMLRYIGRAPGALFGLDQINLLMAMSLAVGPCGDAYSLDHLWRKRTAATSGRMHAAIQPSVGANIAIRLTQLHMCVIYAFAGTSKLMGPSWWDGTAMWQAFASLEYQSMDMTWLAHWPRSAQLPDPSHDYLGSLLLRADLAASNAPLDVGTGGAAAPGNRIVPGHDDLWHRHAHRQPGLCATHGRTTHCGVGIGSDGTSGFR